MTDDDGRHLDHAASIWAAATAARDRDPEPASLDEARPVIRAVLARSPRAFLVLATDDDKPVGFAALAPAHEGNSMNVDLTGYHWARGWLVSPAVLCFGYIASQSARNSPPTTTTA